MAASTSKTQYKYNVRWDNHPTSLLQSFCEHLKKEQLVDVTLSCQGEFVKAHRIILSSCSPYFREVFELHKTNPHPVIIMDTARFEDIRAIVTFMYTGEVQVNVEDLQSLLKTAESLKIKGFNMITAAEAAAVLHNQNHAQNSEFAARKPTQHYAEASDNVWTPNVYLHAGFGLYGNGHGSSRSGSGDSSMHLHGHRKRKRTTNTSNDVNVNEKSNGFSLGRSSTMAAAIVDEGTSSCYLPVERFKTPFIIDIVDVADNQETLKDTSHDSCDGIQNSKAKTKEDSLLDKALSEQKKKNPRHPSAFMIFRNEWRKKLAAQFPNDTYKETSARLLMMWGNIAESYKAEFLAAAKEAIDDEKKKYHPDSYYNPVPKEPRIRQNSALPQTERMMEIDQCYPINLVKSHLNDEHGGGAQAATEDSQICQMVAVYSNALNNLSQ